METKPGAQISTRAFLQSLLILAVLICAAGILTRLVPAGSYSRVTIEGRQMIDPATFQLQPAPDYPIWRWLTAPIEVLFGPDSLTIIIIIFFLLMVGVAFAVLDDSGLLRLSLGLLVKRFEGQKYRLLLLISFFFMCLGAFFGIFEEVVPLVPLMIALSYSLGWDSLVGLGMSILATNMGFSAAISNPFTLGVAQKLAGLPLFSGAWLRIIFFVAIYVLFSFFLLRYARRVERRPEASLVFQEDQANRGRYTGWDFNQSAGDPSRFRRGLIWMGGCLILILLVLVGGPLLPVLSDLALPLIGVIFLTAGLGAAFLTGSPASRVRKTAWQGILGIAPAIPLILMAASVKHIVASGGILDTILHSAAGFFSQSSPFLAAVMIYAIALVIEIFIGSGSAKAFLLMPILLPLADLVHVTRQVAVTAYCFGDGFSNLAYPTNPVLLISLGLSVVSYGKWLRWTLSLWAWVILISLAFLGLATAIGYGPF